MTAPATRARLRVGELRPSQLLTSFGVGSVVDLPHLSVAVMGLDDWNADEAQPVSEERLLAAVRYRLGSQVSALRTPPYEQRSDNPFDDAGLVGVPVAVFPRWLRCPRCWLLAPLDSRLFDLKDSASRPERIRYVHTNCTRPGKPPAVLAARFLLACAAGHLDDFPWLLFAHKGPLCPQPVLELRELGVSGRPADVEVRCRTCGGTRRMSEAFGEDAAKRLPACRGRHPHLASFDRDGCDQPVRTILLGASNSWFPVTLRVLSIPTPGTPLAQKVAELWGLLKVLATREVLEFARGLPEYASLREYSTDEVWAAMQAHRSGAPPPADPTDLLSPEWAAFTQPGSAPSGADFALREVPPPAALGEQVGQVVLAERLREVVALTGFTRVDAPDEPAGGDAASRHAPLTRREPLWVPCAEVRGEGVFLRLREQPLAGWVRRAQAHPRADRFAAAERRWRADRGLDPDARPWPGMRYLLLHTLSHALMRQFALDCGYGAAGLRERLYSHAGAQMAGILLYTAAPDAEGTLGGLVELGHPDRLEELFLGALDQARLCSSDPLCAEHTPGPDRTLHGAACHACLFAAETSCERSNHYLDRSTLVPTFATPDLAYFP